MAANSEVHLVLAKISEDHLECPVCTNRFINPTMLDCLHSFCFTCLQELHQQDPNNSILQCPLCKKKTTLEDNTVESLPNDFKLNAQVDEFTFQEQLKEGHGSEVKCQGCDKDHKAVSRCTDCEHFICQDCQQAHQDLVVLKSHQIYTLVQLRSGEVKYRSKIRDYIPKCGKHSDLTLTIYCNTCQKLECTTCSILDNMNSKHDFVGIPKALDKCRQEVAEMEVKAKKRKADFQTAMEQAVYSKKKLKNAFSKTKTKIYEKASAEISKITEEGKKLQQEAKRIYKDRIQAFQTAEERNSKEVSQAELKLDKVDRLMTQGSPHEILLLKQKLLKNLEELAKKQSQSAPFRMSFLDFEEGGGSIGRLVLDKEQRLEAERASDASPRHGAVDEERKWELKDTYEHFITGQWANFKDVNRVAAFQSSEIVVADTKHKCLIEFLIRKETSKGKTKSVLIPHSRKSSCLQHPEEIAVNTKDQLIVLDNKQIKIIDRSYKMICEFTPGYKPSCLAVDDNDLIALGDSDKKQVTLHNPDGSPIKTLSTPTGADYMTIYKRRILFTNYTHRKLHSIDYNGAEVFSVDIKNGQPDALCCDSDGYIFLVTSEKYKYGVHYYSPDGEYIGNIINDCGFPYDITFTPGGDLAMATYNSVKIYHHV